MYSNTSIAGLIKKSRYRKSQWLRGVVSTAMPLILANMVTSLGEFVDILICLYHAPEQVGLVGYYYRCWFILGVIITSISIATSIRANRFFAQQKNDDYIAELSRLRHYLNYSTFGMGLLSTIFIIIAMYLFPELERATIVLYGVLHISSVMLTAYMQPFYLDILANKKSTLVMKAGIQASLINVVTSYVLVAHLGFGVAGLALGTLLSKCFVFFYYINTSTLIFSKQAPRNDRRDYHKDIIHSLATMGTTQIVGLLIVSLLATHSMTIAIYSLLLASMSLVHGIFLAWGTAIAVFVPQLFASSVSRRLIETKNLLKYLTIHATGIAVIATLGCILVATSRGLLDNNSPNMWVAFFIFLWMLSVAIGTAASKGILRANGDLKLILKMAVWSSLCRLGIIFFTVQLAVAQQLNLIVIGVTAITFAIQTYYTLKKCFSVN